MTVTEAFQTFKSELELPDRQRLVTAVAQEEIRSRIATYLDVPNSFLTGSYARYTKIFPLNDIDVMLIRNSQRVELSTSGGVIPNQALEGVASAVAKAYPSGATIKKQSRSVNAQIKGRDFGFDLIPAWLRKPDGYWIPDTDNGSWLPTDPEAHAKLMTQANNSCGDKLKPLIKMLKHWSRNNYDLIRSFHIELICANIFARGDLANFSLGVATVLVHLPDYIGKPMMDPIYGSSRVDKQLAAQEHSQLLQRINSDAQNAIQALRLESTGDHSAAIEKWKRIFLHGFPK